MVNYIPPNRKRFLTPNAPTGGVFCRTVRLPDDPEWIALFDGVFSELAEIWVWRQNGTLTEEEAAAAWLEIFLDQDDGCSSCAQPGGEPIVRLNEDGEFEELIDGDWAPPAGDNEIPPTPPREDGTDQEKRCLAAANATNVLKVLYEEVTDMYLDGLTLLEAIAHFVAFVAAIILLPGGLIAAAIALALVLFRIMFETAEFVTADYWTTAFDDKMQCALYECSSVDGEDVVTFDYMCFQDLLAVKINAGEDPLEVVLWGQVQAMLMFLGVDGLNLAGATTAITTAECLCGWTYRWNFLETDGDFAYDGDQSPYNVGTWTLGLGWGMVDTGADNGCGDVFAAGLKSQTFDIPSDCVIERLSLAATNQVSCAHAEAFIGNNRSVGLSHALKLYVDPGWSTTMSVTGAISGPQSGWHTGIEQNHNAADGYITAYEIYGTGTPPDFVGGEFL